MNTQDLEVLPDDAPIPAVAKSKHYVVRLRHDLGTLRVITAAADHRAAIARVIASANAPRQAVVSVQKIKTKHREATPGTLLKGLKYATVTDEHTPAGTFDPES